jgi:hypothetical protein
VKKVVLGSRTAGNEAARAWAAENPGGAHGTFADAAAASEIVVNATAGNVTAEVLRAAGAGNLAGKVLIDVSNALDFSGGFPPKVSTFDGLGVAEVIQRDHPTARVVKTLNTMNNRVMADPSLVPGDHSVFLSGDDAEAKETVKELLRGFGWRDAQFMDLGGIATAQATEAFVVLWVHIYGRLGDDAGPFNIAVLRGPAGA